MLFVATLQSYIDHIWTVGNMQRYYVTFFIGMRVTDRQINVLCPISLTSVYLKFFSGSFVNKKLTAKTSVQKE